MTFTAGRILQPGDLVSEDAWTPYSMAWTASTTNPSIGNGSLTAKWIKLSAHTVAVSAYFAHGSTTTKGSGVYAWSLPFPQANTQALGLYLAYDSGVALRGGYLAYASSTTVNAYINGATGPLGDATFTGTFTSSNQKLFLIYEI